MISLIPNLWTVEVHKVLGKGIQGTRHLGSNVEGRVAFDILAGQEAPEIMKVPPLLKNILQTSGVLGWFSGKR